MVDYYIKYAKLTRLKRKAYQAQQNNHSEVAGLLSIDSTGQIEFHFIENLSNKPYSYSITKKQINECQKELPKEKKILGTFHSHPLTAAIPGKADIKNGFYKSHELIYDVCGDTARLWKKIKSTSKYKIKEIPIKIIY